MNYIAKSRGETASAVADPSTTGRPADSDTLDADWRRHAIATALGVCALIGLFWGAASHAAETWYVSATFNHGFLIFPVSLYLIWLKRDELVVQAPAPTWWGAALILVPAAAWLLAYVAGVILVQQFALVGMIYAVFLGILGVRTVKILAFPLFYMLFAVPFGEFMIAPLQDFTADFVVNFMRGIGVPIYMDGVFISIPNGDFEVAEACSGVRFLIATFALGLLFGHLTFHQPWRRIAFVGLALVVPVIANGFRAFGIVYVAYITDNEIAAGVDHIVYGWVFFAAITVILLLIGRWMREPEGTEPEPTRASTGGLAPVGRNPFVALAVVAGVAAIAPAYASVIDDATPGAKRPVIAPEARGWQRLSGYDDSWKPSYRGADSQVLATYVKDGRRVHVFIAHYGQQRQGAELVSGSNVIVDDKVWVRASTNKRQATIEGAPVDIERTRMRTHRGARVVWRWYWVGGSFVADRYLTKIREAESKLFGGIRESAVIAIAADYVDEAEAADALLQEFMNDVAPLTAVLLQASEGRN